MIALNVVVFGIPGWIIQAGLKRYISPVLQQQLDQPMKLKVENAGEKGKGVFATEVIQPGELVIDFAGEERWIWDIPEELWQHAFQVDYDRYVVPVKESPGWYLNHSCEPNCVIIGRTRVVALARIEPGQEVTMDYSTNVGWDGFTMECKCGSRGCRGVIRSYGHLGEQLKRRYGARVSAFLLEKDAQPPPHV